MDVDGAEDESDYLGVRRLSGCGWQARVPLRLDALGAPALDGFKCEQPVELATELGGPGGWVTPCLGAARLPCARPAAHCAAGLTRHAPAKIQLALLPAEAALVRDLGLLWYEQSCGPDAFSTSRLYNFPLRGCATK